jgi:hypothetical protein
METIIKIQLPLKRIPAPDIPKRLLPRRERWFGWLIGWGGGSRCEFGGTRINSKTHITVFRWHVLTIHRNQYHDRSDKERADEYLKKWSACEKELRMWRAVSMGEEMSEEVKKLIRESFGVDFDEGTVR